MALYSCNFSSLWKDLIFATKIGFFLLKSITKNVSFVTYLTSVNIYIFSTKIQSVIRKMSSAKWLAQVLTSWVHICPELIQIALFRNVTTTKSLHVLHAAVVPTSFNCSRSTFERMSMLSKLIHTTLVRIVTWMLLLLHSSKIHWRVKWIILLLHNSVQYIYAYAVNKSLTLKSKIF